MSTTLYHGSHRGTFTAHVGLCLTDDPDIAASYAGSLGKVYAIEVELGIVVEVDGYDRETNTAPGDCAPEALAAVHSADIITFADESPSQKEHATWRFLTEVALTKITNVVLFEE